MPDAAKQDITSTSVPTTTESPLAQELVQQAFHQQMRERIRNAVREVTEEVMCEELTLFLGAQWGESSPKRHGSFKNGAMAASIGSCLANMKKK